MTTENVAVLFTDMVGSTALASGLLPVAADELRREHFSILRQAVAEAGGSEVKNPVLGCYDEADAYFTQAATFNHRANAKFFAAATNLSWARMLAERRAPGDIAKARTFSPKHTLRQRPTGTRTSNDAPQKHSNTWTDRWP